MYRLNEQCKHSYIDATGKNVPSFNLIRSANSWSNTLKIHFMLREVIYIFKSLVSVLLRMILLTIGTTNDQVDVYAFAQ